MLSALSARKGIRVWSEKFSDGVLEMYKMGVRDPEILITASFVFGSQELYSWLELNRKVQMLRTERTNNPSQIARQAKMQSINAALQVDLYDQAKCFGHTQNEQALNIITNAAHPDAREELTAKAAEFGLISHDAH